MFYIVPQSVVDKWQGYITKYGGLCFVQDIYGRWVVNTEAKGLCDYINWDELETVELLTDDFPADEIPSID
jgi:hypothetical protein